MISCNHAQLEESGTETEQERNINRFLSKIKTFNTLLFNDLLF